MTMAGDITGMDREDLTDRLPTDRIPLNRVPGYDSASEPTATFDGETAGPDAAARGREARDGAETGDEAVGDGDLTDEGGPSRREQARKALLGVSIGGGILAVAAAVVRRLLGEDEPEEASEADEKARIEPDTETEPAPDAEAVAAVIGLAFQLLVRRLAGQRET